MPSLILILTLLFKSTGALASASVPSLNQCPDIVFIDAFENDSVPSNGVGGLYPGSLQHTIPENNTFYYYIPSSYHPSKPMPLLVVWHGTAGAGNSPTAAQDMRNYWLTEAENNQFIVVAQASTGDLGGWVPGIDSERLANIFVNMESRYNIETTRRYVWGFSAGGHLMHAIALDNADYFAAYAISAGVLDAFANDYAYTPANASRKIPVFVSVGDSDSLLSFAQDDKIDFIQAGWKEGLNYWLDVFSGDHTLPINMPTKAWDKICIFTNLD